MGAALAVRYPAPIPSTCRKARMSAFIRSSRPPSPSWPTPDGPTGVILGRRSQPCPDGTSVAAGCQLAGYLARGRRPSPSHLREIQPAGGHVLRQFAGFGLEPDSGRSGGPARRVAAGVQYALARGLSLGASFTYVDLGTPKISHLENPMAGVLEGRYSPARLPVVGFRLPWLRWSEPGLCVMPPGSKTATGSMVLVPSGRAGRSSARSGRDTRL